MDVVKLKVVCNFVGHQQGWSGTSPVLGSIKLNPVGPSTGGNSEENAKFFAATPSGSIEFQTINEDAVKMFVPGQTYIVTITSDSKNTTTNK